MSTIYTDALGNKFLGNCRYGNHDINYPSTNWLKSVDGRTIRTTFLEDLQSLFTSAGWSNITVANPWPTTNGASIFQASIPGESASNNFRLRTGIDSYNYRPDQPDIAGVLGPAKGSGNDASLYNTDFDYVVTVDSNSLIIKPFYYRNAYTNEGMGAGYRHHFLYYGKLVDVNTNFGYYNASFVNQCFIMWGYDTFGDIATISEIAIPGRHYIVGANKDILQTGDAQYGIACQGGSPTPTGQWATYMYVFDNNATLGYPCIGRVPNMLLGVGTFTYLKPVELITAPDAGSNLWLPVGTYAGKTLLMRCYAE